MRIITQNPILPKNSLRNKTESGTITMTVWMLAGMMIAACGGGGGGGGGVGLAVSGNAVSGTPGSGEPAPGGTVSGDSGSGGPTPGGPVTPQPPGKLTVIDGPVHGARVIVDLDGDGVIDEGEVLLGRTNSRGEVDIPAQYSGKAMIVQLSDDNGLQSIDSVTGVTLTGTWRSLPESVGTRDIVTPLTDLITRTMEANAGSGQPTPQSILDGIFGTGQVTLDDVLNKDNYLLDDTSEMANIITLAATAVGHHGADLDALTQAFSKHRADLADGDAANDGFVRSDMTGPLTEKVAKTLGIEISPPETTPEDETEGGIIVTSLPQFVNTPPVSMRFTEGGEILQEHIDSNPSYFTPAIIGKIEVTDPDAHQTLTYQYLSARHSTNPTADDPYLFFIMAWAPDIWLIQNPGTIHPDGHYIVSIRVFDGETHTDMDIIVTVADGVVLPDSNPLTLPQDEETTTSGQSFTETYEEPAADTGGTDTAPDML